MELACARSTGRLGTEIKPGDVVGITSFTQNFNSALRIAKDVKSKDPSVPVIVGGNHVTFLPESMSEDMDVAVIGEGEETLLELRSLTHKHRNYDRIEMNQDPGCSSRQHKETFVHWITVDVRLHGLLLDNPS